MKEIRIMLLCSTRFGIPSIIQLQHSGLLATVCVPAKAEETAEHIQSLFNASQLPVQLVHHDRPDEQIIAAIKKYKINLVLMMTWPFKISEAARKLPAEGFYNFHTGPLPLYRGADPIFWQLANRESKAGISIHEVVADFDSGDILMKRMIEISSLETHGSLTTKLSVIAVEIIGLLLKFLLAGIKPPSAKQDSLSASFFKKQTSEDITINWERMSASQIVALCAACNPWNKGAVTFLDKRVIRLPFAELMPGGTHSVSPGMILAVCSSGMQIAASQSLVINVPFLYCDEGFLPPIAFPENKIVSGKKFQDRL